MTRSRLGAIGLLAGVLLIGTLLGGAAGTFTERRDCVRKHSHGPRLGYVERLTRDLELTPAQRDSVAGLLDRHRPVMDSLWSMVRPQFDTERENIRREIRALLTPEQLTKYNALVERQNQRRAEQERRGNEKR
ncbi:MAG TPA: hypothetical protein VFN96_07300 [Gemmatimonadales bacterium]|nr:hypothetical protein [Gemmatimonadales bacterium]